MMMCRSELWHQQHTQNMLENAQTEVKGVDTPELNVREAQARAGQQSVCAHQSVKGAVEVTEH